MDYSKPPGWPLPPERLKRLKELERRYAELYARLREIREAKKKRRPHLRLIRFDKQETPSEKSNQSLEPIGGKGRPPLAQFFVSFL